MFLSCAVAQALTEMLCSDHIVLPPERPVDSDPFLPPPGVRCGCGRTGPLTRCVANRAEARDGVGAPMLSRCQVGWTEEQGPLPSVDTARGKAQQTEACTAQGSFYLFVLTEPGNMGVGIGTT